MTGKLMAVKHYDRMKHPRLRWWWCAFFPFWRPLLFTLLIKGGPFFLRDTVREIIHNFQSAIHQCLTVIEFWYGAIIHHLRLFALIWNINGFFWMRGEMSIWPQRTPATPGTSTHITQHPLHHLHSTGWRMWWFTVLWWWVDEFLTCWHKRMLNIQWRA